MSRAVAAALSRASSPGAGPTPPASPTPSPNPWPSPGASPSPATGSSPSPGAARPAGEGPGGAGQGSQGAGAQDPSTSRTAQDPGGEPGVSSQGAQDPATVQEPADPTAGHSWHMPLPGGTAIMVVGGTTSVDTVDLDALASALVSVAGLLEDAAAQASAALERARAWAVGLPMVAPSSLSGTAASSGHDYQAVVVEGNARRVECVAALEEVVSGPGSLQDAAATLRALASDVTACSQTYTLAETGAAPSLGSMGPVEVTAFDAALVSLALGDTLGRAAEVVRELTSSGSPLYLLVKDDEDLQAAVQGLGVLLDDPATAQWVKDDAVRLVLLTRWLARAETGRESATIQAYLEEVAERLDPWVSQQLPAQVQQGTRTVEASTLSPMQRASLYLGSMAAASGAWLFGPQTGVTVTPVGGRGSTRARPPQEDPYGLDSPVPPGLVGQGEPSSAPGSASEVIRHGAQVQARGHGLGQGYEDAGTIAIQQVDHADGTRSWVVYVPGTTDWTSGDSEPQDLLTNLEAVGGAPTAMDSAVVTAMRQAGIQPGEEVAMYGHSQGGITVSNLAADPAVQERYTVTTVLTAGSPTAWAAVPGDVHALHLENTADAVPGLDAAPNPVGEHRQTAVVDTRSQGGGPYPHGAQAYADAVEGMEAAEPSLEEWSRSLVRATGAGEEGVVVTEYTFAVERMTGAGFYEREPTPQPQQAPRPRDDPSASPSRQP